MSSSQYQDYPPFSSMETAGTPTAASNPVDTLALLPEDDYPLPFPQQQTYSWRHQGEECWHRERSHMRMVIEDVRRPLTKFTSTQELAMAIRDAIEGHRQAWEEAGVLHRDISSGSILIRDESEGHGRHIGFLHDLDYNSMRADGIYESPPHARSLDEESAYHAQFKERAESYFFMALDLINPIPTALHRPHHDLESYYWVLLWVVLRYTDCHRRLKGTKGPQVCAHVFKIDEEDSGFEAKQTWLLLQLWPEIRDNVPLTTLVAKFSELLNRQVMAHLNKTNEVYLQYDAILEIFDQTLAMEGWPEQDGIAACTLLNLDPRTAVARQEPILRDVAPRYSQHQCEGRAPRARPPLVSNAGSLAAPIGSRAYLSGWSVAPSQSGSQPAASSKRPFDTTQLPESAKTSRLPKRSKGTTPPPTTPSAAAAGTSAGQEAPGILDRAGGAAAASVLNLRLGTGRAAGEDRSQESSGPST